jgi:heme exporter protein A
LFEDLSFDVKPKQLLLIEGRNGAGKTTLLHILAGLRTADEGDIYLNDSKIDSFDSEYYQNIAYLGHLNGLKLELTARENLALSMALGDPKGIDIDAALEYVTLVGYEDEPVKKFSAGMKRRTSLARLLVMKPAIWILDEPYTSLDVDGIKKIEVMMVEHIKQGGSVIMTSHHEVKLDEIDLVSLNLTELKCR